MLAPDCETFLQKSKQNRSPKKDQASKVQDWEWKEPNINKRGLLKLPIKEEKILPDRRNWSLPTSPIISSPITLILMNSFTWQMQILSSIWVTELKIGAQINEHQTAALP